MENIESWSLIKYEHWFNPVDYVEKIWFKSKLMSCVLYTFERISQNLTHQRADKYFYSLSEEPAQTALKIIEIFKKDVELNRARFCVVRLLMEKDLNILLNDERLSYSKLLERLEEITCVIHPENNMLNSTKNSTSIIFSANGHYSSSLNKIVADVIAECIVSNKRSFSKGRSFGEDGNSE